MNVNQVFKNDMKVSMSIEGRKELKEIGLGFQRISTNKRKTEIKSYLLTNSWKHKKKMIEKSSRVTIIDLKSFTLNDFRMEILIA